MRIPFSLSLILLLLPLPLPAAVFVVPTDSELIEDAEGIVIATVRDISSEFLPNGEIVTNIEMESVDVLKGEFPGNVLRLQEPGGMVGSEFMIVSESAEYWKGNRALIFLDRNSEGRWRTYGLSLGKFDFVTDPTGRKLAVRWAREQDISAWTPEGHPHEERLRDGNRFVTFILNRLSPLPAPVKPGQPPIATSSETSGPDYFVSDVRKEDLSFNPHIIANQTTYPPSAYTQGMFRWNRFDAGGSATFLINGSQPGFDSTGAAQRAVAAWTNDPGSNVDYRLGGTTTAGFIGDSISIILFNSATEVPAGAVGYSRWFGSGTHVYKGETFNTIVEGDVVVKSGLTATQQTFEEIVTHELGHTLGFRHSDQGTPSSVQAVMKAVLSGNYGSTLGPWDIDAVRTVYTGPSGALLSAPASLVATATSTTQISISWNSTPGATQYELERSSNGGPYTVISRQASTSFTDTGRSPGVTYLYRVRAFSADSNSPFSNIDHATTVLFTDDPLISGFTVVKAIHLTEIRQAVNAVRVAAGLAPVTWTDPSPQGVVIKAVHILEIRNALTPALTAIGKSATYTQPLSTGTPIRAVHFQELRNLTK